MTMSSSSGLLIILLLCLSAVVQIYGEIRTCTNRNSPCFLKRLTCPVECPTSSPKNPKSKVCFIDCNSPICKAECKNRKPNCNARGAACLDPRFIGGDDIVFYFHGKSNEHFSLVSDLNMQINARFIGLRPAGRTRDYTWIQSLGILFNAHTFSLEASQAEIWDDEIDHLKFSHNGREIVIQEGYMSSWKSPLSDLLTTVLFTWRYNSDCTACHQKLRVYLAGHTSQISRILQSLVLLCLYWEEKISIKPRHFSLQIVHLVFSLLLESWTRQILLLGTLVLLIVPAGPIAVME